MPPKWVVKTITTINELAKVGATGSFFSGPLPKIKTAAVISWRWDRSVHLQGKRSGI